MQSKSLVEYTSGLLELIPPTYYSPHTVTCAVPSTSAGLTSVFGTATETGPCTFRKVV